MFLPPRSDVGIDPGHPFVGHVVCAPIARVGTHGFRRFSFRGVGSVRLEWQLICLTGNILKLFRSGWTPQTA